MALSLPFHRISNVLEKLLRLTASVHTLTEWSLKLQWEEIVGAGSRSQRTEPVDL